MTLIVASSSSLATADLAHADQVLGKTILKVFFSSMAFCTTVAAQFALLVPCRMPSADAATEVTNPVPLSRRLVWRSFSLQFGPLVGPLPLTHHNSNASRSIFIYSLLSNILDIFLLFKHCGLRT